MRRVVVIALSGLLLAAGLGLVTHLIVRDTVGLPATSLETVAPLAPPQAQEPATTRVRTVPPQPPPATATTVAPPPPPTTTREDDSGRGRGRNRGRGGDDGGSSGSGGGGRDD